MRTGFVIGSEIEIGFEIISNKDDFRSDGAFESLICDSGG